MKSLPAVLTDPVYQKPAAYSWLETQLLKVCQDERDLPFARLLFNIALTLIPLAILLYIPGLPNWIWWSAAVLYHFLNNVTFKGPFGLMLHCVCHRPLFKKQHDWLNMCIPWVIGPFFGQTPETYYTHHMGMHHAENNMPEDTSSTMSYQRDSFFGFLQYLGDFVTVGIFRLLSYFDRKKKKKFYFKSIRGEVAFFAWCIGLSFVNFPATFAVFILPFIISRVVMMLGNWTQHAFVNPIDPANAYHNSVTCLNTKYNHKCWNDGYHTSHHVRPALHWTEHPNHFLKTLPKYVQNDAIVFEGIHWLHLFAWLMTKRYDLMAKHFVNVGDRYKNDEEIIEMLKSRTVRFSEEATLAYN
ncbi:fatty acid desaturase family protein [Hymenobacter sp. HDW8]|uniref:fatty acid desaturase family protein n=1 Tax=Hymenobacter sp. HDW8 TaxID=2714932 RepID=UPI001408977E|nr:fatty acid desaturase [Hymenobacter sp. HDW8]QIL75790.1 fatty acid desaturase [Hymenobacter sp. HDW8]